MKAEVKLAFAREIVRRDAPYIVGILYALVPHADESVRTMETTEHMILRYNPTWVEKLENNVVAGILMHECSHVFRDHIARFKDILLTDEAYIANLAMDMALNPDLLTAGWKLTPGAIIPEKYKLPVGKTAEWYLAQLRKMNIQPPPQNGPGGHGEVCSGQCGGIARNSSSGEQENQLDAEMGRTPTDKERIVRATAEAIKKHAEGRGRVPGALLEAAVEISKPPKIDWKQQLAQLIRKATGRIKSGGQDFSLRRPSKRSYSRGILRPGLIQQLPEICIIRDTSGSMGPEQINAATVESIGIIKAAGVDTVWYIDADAAVAFSKRIRLAELQVLPVHGRGGTNFCPAIEAVNNLRPRPDITIYITDGDGYSPPHPPDDMEFIWCVIPSYYKRKPANWGHLVVVSEENITLADPYTK